MEMEAEPNGIVDEIVTEMSETDNSVTEEAQTLLPPTGDIATDMATEHMMSSGYGDPILESQSATSSKSKYNSVTTDIKKKQIQEFFRILRPHLPRKSKSKAYKMLQNIAKGTVVASSIQRRIKKKKPKTLPVRKQKAEQLKTKSLSIVRRNVRSICGSSDSCRSYSSCPHCGYSCSRIARC